MPLPVALSGLCPRRDGVEPPGCDLALRAAGGARIRCHERLLRARCPALPQGESGEVDVQHEDASVVYALLRWVYCEVVDERLRNLDMSSSPEIRAAVATQAECVSVVRLARRWGLRDAGCLQERVANSKCLFRREGTLAEDVLRAYDAGEFGDQSVLIVLEEASGRGPGSAKEEPEVLAGGWRELLRERSAYFGAMLCGAWAEGTGEGAAVRVQWDPEQLARLLRFLHGAPLVDRPEDLAAAAECAQFFGAPDALAACADWIATNLSPATAPGLWSFLEGLPCSSEEEREALADADEACFAYHIKHFQELSLTDDDSAEEGRAEISSDAPIFGLSVALFRRLLTSGLVEMPTVPLLGVVKTFAHLKEKRGQGAARGLCDSLRPPAVLFNRENRSRLLPTTSEVTARMFA